MAHGTWVTWALLSAFFAALTAILAKLGLQRIDSDFATLLRTGFVFVLLVPLIAWTGKWRNPLTLPAASLGLLALSAVATGASWLCYFRALQLGPASLVAPVDKLSLVLVAVLAFVLLGVRPSPTAWAALGLIAAGIGLLVVEGARTN